MSIFFYNHSHDGSLTLKTHLQYYKKYLFTSQEILKQALDTTNSDLKSYLKGSVKFKRKWSSYFLTQSPLDLRGYFTMHKTHLGYLFLRQYQIFFKGVFNLFRFTTSERDHEQGNSLKINKLLQTIWDEKSQIQPESIFNIKQWYIDYIWQFRLGLAFKKQTNKIKAKRKKKIITFRPFFPRFFQETRILLSIIGLIFRSKITNNDMIASNDTLDNSLTMNNEGLATLISNTNYEDQQTTLTLKSNIQDKLFSFFVTPQNSEFSKYRQLILEKFYTLITQ